MTLITWACLKCVQELTTILGPQNRTQGSCDQCHTIRYLHTYKSRVCIDKKSIKCYLRWSGFSRTKTTDLET